MNSGIGVGALPGRRGNITEGISNNNSLNNINSNNADVKFNPAQNAHLMSNLINLNLQLNKLVKNMIKIFFIVFYEKTIISSIEYKEGKIIR